MPLLKEWDINEHTIAAIWKVEEPEDFFTTATGIRPDINNEKRRMEHLAGRYLLQYLKSDFPLHSIAKDEHDKPRIDNDDYYFSISHSYPYIAAVISTHKEAGIDIQTFHPRIERIQHKFLSVEEQAWFNNDIQLLTLAWCAKEAAYKWQGRRGIEFIGQLPIVDFRKYEALFELVIYTNTPSVPQMVYIEGFNDADFSCAYIAYTEDWVIY